MVLGRSSNLLLNWYAFPLFLSLVAVVSYSLSISTLSFSCYPFIQMLLRVFLLSDLHSLTGPFIHLDLMSWILDVILTKSYLVCIRFLSWITDDEKGFKDLRVSRLYLVLAGLILIMLFFSVRSVAPVALFLYWIVASILEEFVNINKINL